MSNYDCCGVIILIMAVCVICFILGKSNKNATTLQLQQISKDWDRPNSIIDKADLIDEQDDYDPRHQFRSLREFGSDFVNDVTRPEEAFGNLDINPDVYLSSPDIPSSQSTRIQVDEDDDGDYELEIDLSQEPSGEFTKTEVLVNPLINRQVGDIIIGEGRKRKSRTAGGRGVQPDMQLRCQQREYENDPECMSMWLDNSNSSALPRSGGAIDATMMSRSNIDKLAGDTLQRHPQNPVELRGHHNQLASRHVQDVSNHSKRLSSTGYMTPEHNGNASSEIFTPAIPEGVRRSAQMKQNSRGAYVYQVFCVSQNLIYTPLTIMPFDEYNNPILVEPLVFNFHNSFVSSGGVQELSFSTDKYKDIKFIEINTLLTQQGWNGKIWIRVFAEGNLLSTMSYNSALDPQFGWKRFICTSGQAAYNRKDAESTCVGGRIRR